MKIEHVALYVKNLEKSAAFFERYFKGKRNGLYRNPRTGFSSYFLSFEDSARLELMSLPEVSNESRPLQYGYAHIAFGVGSKSAVDQLTARLEVDGFRVKSHPRITGDGYYESCVYDVDGNSIEITE